MKIPRVLDIRYMGEDLPELLNFGKFGSPKKRRDYSLGVIKITDGAKAHLIYSVPAKKICVTADILAAQSLVKRLSSYPEARVALLPPRDDVLVYRKGGSLLTSRNRIASLSRFLSGDVDALVVTAEALMQLCPLPKAVLEFSVLFKKEQYMSPIEAADKLAAAGYVRQEMIAEEGDFAQRGDILDVYPAGGEPHRINFFDETIENIKKLNPLTMRAFEETESLFLHPVSDVMFTKEDVAIIREKLHARRGESSIAYFLDGLRAGVASTNYGWLSPFSKDNQGTLFDYLDYVDGPAVMILDEPKAIADKFNLLSKELNGRLKALVEADEIVSEHKACLLSPHEIIRRLIITTSKMFFTSLDGVNPLFESKQILTPHTHQVTKYYLSPHTLAQDLKNFVLNKFKVLICTGNLERAEALRNSLYESEISSEISEDGNGDASIIISPLKIESGVVYPTEKVALIGVSDCIGKNKEADALCLKMQFIAPKAGDYVVHKIHGIGVCEGTTVVKNGEFDKEYVVIRYRDGDILYVAVDQMDNLQKFIGEENPRLNKIGGKEFAREKEKVRKSVKKLAFNLLKLYAVREKQQGFTYSQDTVWQQEFEDTFEYEETADQQKAIAAVKEDMENGKVMDRVIVGDVGFGKTEVAFRAMFKTVLDGKQAVLLAPTTILARQHYENFVKRLEPFGIKCGILTRLQTSSENGATISALREGSMPFVIATHRVLSMDIDFKDLGLLVIDEEQRFGVNHKEALKERYPQVNVLTLSATPIPRTLNMALSGVRDISLLETAPKGRLPIQTYVVPYSDTLVVDAILRESGRGGQTLILLNDILRLDTYAANLSSQLPSEIKITTAHGQMMPREIEKRIASFYDKKADVLIATTIIENGIDLPDANTLIVIDSGRFGVSQLYQLRGRVGRRGVLAHAYFTVSESRSVTGDAEKRLKVLLENTELGSGFKVALSDLSIRGAGSILGAEQHGHIEMVGYEMYIDLLNEAIEELRTGKRREDKCEVEMQVDLPAFVSSEYISDRDKMRIYKRIAEVDSMVARDELIKELEEIYGAADEPLINLIDIALIKNWATGFNVAKIKIARKGAGIIFKNAEIFRDEHVMRAVSEGGRDMVLTSTIPPALIFDVAGLSNRQKLDRITKFFVDLIW